jgi:hypothetical protein
MNRSQQLAAIAGVLSIMSRASIAQSDTPPEGGFDLSWYTIDCGAETSSGGSFQLAGTIGQPDAGAAMTGGNFALVGGFAPGVGEPTAIPCPADIFPVGAADGIVGPGDLGQLLSKWGPCSAPCPADLFPVGAPDAIVGPGDLGQLLSKWGQCQ